MTGQRTEPEGMAGWHSAGRRPGIRGPGEYHVCGGWRPLTRSTSGKASRLHRSRGAAAHPLLCPKVVIAVVPQAWADRAAGPLACTSWVCDPDDREAPSTRASSRPTPIVGSLNDGLRAAPTSPEQVGQKGGARDLPPRPAEYDRQRAYEMRNGQRRFVARTPTLEEIRARLGPRTILTKRPTAIRMPQSTRRISPTMGCPASKLFAGGSHPARLRHRLGRRGCDAFLEKRAPDLEPLPLASTRTLAH